jgi:hypothetical protein
MHPQETMENAAHADATPCAFAAAANCASPTCQRNASFRSRNGFARATAAVLARRDLPEDVVERAPPYRSTPVPRTPTPQRGRPPAALLKKIAPAREAAGKRTKEAI